MSHLISATGSGWVNPHLVRTSFIDVSLRGRHEVGGSREGARLVEVRRVRLGPRPLTVLLQHPGRDLWREYHQSSFDWNLVIR